MMRVAVIGGGAIGLRHLEALEELEELEACAVVELDETIRLQLARRFGVKAYAGMEDMLAAEQPQIAVIALPHHLHEEAALLCISSGCHLMLEKPMANSTASCDRIIAAAKRQGVTLMVGHTQHYLPENRAAKAVIDEGSLGRFLMAQDTRHVDYFRRNRPPWFFDRESAGGGIMMNLGAHSIDKLQWLTDSRVRKVKASLTYLGDRGNVEGSGMLMLELDGGATGTSTATIVQSGYKGASRSETELIFTNGMLRIVAGEGVYVSKGDSYEKLALPEEPLIPLALQFLDLLASLRSGSEPECSGSYSRSVIEALEAVYLSHESGLEIELGKRESG
ncbi:Gfo/Idh/MocA family oxidoreductase [Paenibacillus sp. HB172176]|uniref:Gfo/Idh/MocA family protein n=1 Tax=Paenibacillus sp. HB172176 TaxID=2493690 RepID=UPI00143B4844|nr:Gfo/Idh/MocA family oxidoreductase [Paenibacillus sp. HB172176]